MMLFLHGSGERGDNLEAVKRNGPPKIVEKNNSFPFVLVSPQCPANENWSDGWAIEALNALLDEIISNYNIDTNKIYLTGLSMGGFGAWALGEAHPERFAAVVPICGGGDPDKACNLRRVPVWVFHGAKDNDVPISNAEDMVDALKRCEGNVKFTIYPDAGHDSWTETYDNPRLYEWMLEQTKKEKKLITATKENVTASSGEVYNAFDGNFGTRWESEQKDPQWIQIDFKELQKIKNLTIFWETAYGKEYEILVSKDNINWKNIFSEKKSDGDVDKINFNNLETRYLKINMLHRGTQWAYSIWEIELE